MTPYSAAAVGSRSSRAELALGGLPHLLGQLRRRRAARAARSPRPARGRPRRARPGSPSAAGAGSTRAGPSPSRTGPATGSSSRARAPRASRERIAEMWRSRCSTSACSSSSCRSSVGIVRSVEATRCASALGSSTFVAASCSSAGRYGASPMICAKRPWTFRVSASTSGVSSFVVRERLELADQVRVVETGARRA